MDDNKKTVIGVVSAIASMFGLAYYTSDAPKNINDFEPTQVQLVTDIEELPVGEPVNEDESVDITTPYEPNESMEEYIPPEPLPPEAEYAPTYEDGQRQLAPEIKEEPTPKKKVVTSKPKPKVVTKQKALPKVKKNENVTVSKPNKTIKVWKPRTFKYDDTYSVTKKKFDSNMIVPEGANARFGRDTP